MTNPLEQETCSQCPVPCRSIGLCRRCFINWDLVIVNQEEISTYSDMIEQTMISKGIGLFSFLTEDFSIGFGMIWIFTFYLRTAESWSYNVGRCLHKSTRMVHPISLLPILSLIWCFNVLVEQCQTCCSGQPTRCFACILHAKNQLFYC